MTGRLTRLKPQIDTLIYYIKLAHEAAGTPLRGDCIGELESVREAFEKFDADTDALLAVRKEMGK